jgi:exosome complex component RRP40
VLRLPPAGVVRAGPGLRRAGDFLVAAAAGALCAEPPPRAAAAAAANTAAGAAAAPALGKLWVAGRARRYAPAPGDVVIGIITGRRGDAYEVDVRGPCPAALPVLAFEGATRRNRPTLKDGDLVYARLAAAPRGGEPELTCLEAGGGGRAAGGAGLGPLAGGTLAALSSAGARALLAAPPPPALAALGAACRFELAVGLNGRVWITGETPAATLAVAAALAALEGGGSGAAAG